MSEEKIYFNGINGSSGDYLFPPCTREKLVEIATDQKFGNFGHTSEDGPLLALKAKNSSEKHFAPNADVDDPTDIAQAGWGVIFAYDANSAIREALQELLDHRKEKATSKKEHFYQEYSGGRGFRPGDSRESFLERSGVGFGPVDPNKMPYYLLIVGDPQTIPFSFQQALSTQFAVGRLHFDQDRNESEEDYLRKYAQYARSVVVAEKKGIALPRRACLFGVQNGEDIATKSSMLHLIQPLSEWMPESVKNYNWGVETIEDATKAKLEKLLGGDETPALLFTSSHGMGFNNGDSRQERHQGAIICQDWPGKEEWGNRAIPEDYYFSGDDISDNARLLGLIAFHFACYGAGTPQFSEFAHMETGFSHSQNSNQKPEIASKAFIASLPQRLLSHPKGGALAVIGHVERAWTNSFTWHNVDQTEVFKSTLKQLVKGEPIGLIFEQRLSKRHSEISVTLGKYFEDIRFNQQVGYGKGEINPDELVSLWTANNDARNYVILGDPAVRLMVSNNGDFSSKCSTIERIERVVLTPSVPPSSVQISPTLEEGSSSVTLQPASPTIAPTMLPPDLGFAGGTNVDYGISASGLKETLNQFMAKLGNSLQQAVDNTTSLEVSTYTSDDMVGVTYSVPTGKFEGTAKLRALTRIALNGNTIICVPEKEGKVDSDLWKIHVDMVQQAQTHRAELLKVMTSTATGLLSAFKVI